MFHIKFINKKKAIYSDLIPEVEHFITMRDLVLKSEEPKIKDLAIDNQIEVCKYLDIDMADFISPNQTHSNNVKLLNKNLKTYPNTDGLVVSSTDVAIYLNFADCTPLIFYDKKHNVGAISHAGWRGTASKIAINTVELMKQEFLSNLDDIYVVIGPSIAICCYNVGKNVYEQLEATVSNIHKHSTEIYDKIYIDLKGINKQQLLDYGIPKENIDVCPYCTSCNNDMFFSHRKENGTTSRHSAVLKLRKNP